MTTVLLMFGLLATPALADDTVAAPAAAAPTIGERTFRGKLSKDAGLWKYGHITLTDAAIVVETRHFPFRVDTEGIEYDAVSSEFKSSRGLLRGSVAFATNSGSVKFLCPARQSKALTEALKERIMARKRLAPGTMHRAEDGHPVSSTTTTTTTTTGK